MLIKIESPAQARIFCLVLFLLGGGLCFALAMGMFQYNLSNYLDRLHSECQTWSHELAVFLGSRASVLKTLCHSRKVRGGLAMKEWEWEVEFHMANSPGFKAVGVVDPSLFFRWIVPFSGNETWKDLNLGEEKELVSFFGGLTQGNRVGISPPLLTGPLQGTMLIAIACPAGAEESYFLAGFVRIDYLVNQVLGPLRNNSSFALLVGGREIFSNVPVEPINPFYCQKVKVPAEFGDFELRLWPRKVYFQSRLNSVPLVGFVLGLLIDFLVVLALYFLLLEKYSSQDIHEKSLLIEKSTQENQHYLKKLEESTRLLQSQNLEIQEKNLKLQQTTEELSRISRDLSIANKFKTEFMANISHELRTPLNSILLLSELLSEETTDTDNAEKRESAKMIHRSGQDLLRIIDQVLDFSQFQEGSAISHPAREKLVAAEVRDSLLSVFQPLAVAKGLSFAVEIQGHFPTAFPGDGKKLTKILFNLVDNAVKFTRKGGVKVRFFIPQRLENLKKRELLERSLLGFAVEDTGVGIAPAQRETLFKPFQQGDGSIAREHGGVGLGLAMAQGLTHLMGGEILVESASEGGTIFLVIVPLRGG